MRKMRKKTKFKFISPEGEDLFERALPDYFKKELRAHAIERRTKYRQMRKAQLESNPYMKEAQIRKAQIKKKVREHMISKGISICYDILPLSEYDIIKKISSSNGSLKYLVIENKLTNHSLDDNRMIKL